MTAAIIFEINDAVPLPAAERARRERAVPKSVLNAMFNYRAAYATVYGVYPVMQWDGEYFNIVGHSSRVKPQRLKEMTNQLKWRAG